MIFIRYRFSKIGLAIYYCQMSIVTYTYDKVFFEMIVYTYLHELKKITNRYTYVYQIPKFVLKKKL